MQFGRLQLKLNIAILRVYNIKTCLLLRPVRYIELSAIKTCLLFRTVRY